MIKVAKILDLIENNCTNLLAEAGIYDIKIKIKSGFYNRTAPVYVDFELAKPETKHWFGFYTDILNQSYTTRYLCSIRNAKIVGQGSIITQNNFLLWESAAEFVAQDLVPDGLKKSKNNNFDLKNQVNFQIEETCLLVKRPWTANFGHWLVDCATILALLKEEIKKDGWSIVIGADVDQGMRKIMQETICTICPDASIIEHKNESPILFKDLRYLMPPHTPPQTKIPETLDLVRKIFVKKQNLLNKKRIYISRADAGLRKLSNEENIRGLLEKYGFDIITLSGLNLHEKATLFAEASVIMGPKGAGLANLIFSPSNCTVICLSPDDFPDPFFWDIAGQRGMRYAEIFGKNTTERQPGHNDFEIEPDRLEKALAEILKNETRTLSADARNEDNLIYPCVKAEKNMNKEHKFTDFSNSLDEIGVKFGTDKSSIHHDYLTFYERYFNKFQKKEIKLLEIGILGGASLATWENYFINAKIIGADIDKTTLRFSRSRVSIEIIDQSNIEDLVRVGMKHGPFDIIIEDGSHFWEHQITTLKTLFPFVKNNGIYIIEDLRTNYGKKMEIIYRGVSNITCMDYLKKLVDLRVADAEIDISAEEDPFLRTYGRAMRSITFYRRMCLIEKIMPDTQSEYLVIGSPYIDISRDQDFLPLIVRAHIGNYGDFENERGCIGPLKIGHNIQGFSIFPPEDLACELAYRARLADGAWTDWASKGKFVGTMGKSENLTGFSIRLEEQDRKKFGLEAIGKFSGSSDLVVAHDGEDCVPTSEGGVLSGMQVVLRAK